MFKRKWSEKPWYSLAVALCIAAAFYVILTHLGALSKGFKVFFSYFSMVVWGLVLAYLMNPLVRLFETRLLKRLRSDRLRHSLSILFTILIVLAVLVLIFLSVIPQLFSSVSSFLSNLDGYLDSLESLVSGLGFSLESVDIPALLDKGADLLKKNAGKILNTTVSAGISVGRFLVAFLLSIYVLAERRNLKKGFKRLAGLLLSENGYRRAVGFVKHADVVLVRYISFSLLESVLVATANAMFMVVMNMSYAPLVSFVVGVMNLVPNFGPMIGAVIGAFILLLAKPIHALWFLLFTVLLQLLDGYVLKPKLFGDSLGISGLWILITIVVGGSMFGIVGMLLAIPAAAILFDVYSNYFLPWLQKKKDGAPGVPAAEAEQAGEEPLPPQK